MSDKNREIFKELESKWKNTLVLIDYKVCRFIGLEEKPSDFYWHLEKWNGKEYLSSCVGSFIPLKEQLDERDYNTMVRIWNLNHLTSHHVI